jgi:hypothetical protein
MGQSTPHGKKLARYGMLTRASDLDEIIDKLSKLRKLYMRFGTCNVSRLYRACLLITLVKELSKYKLDFVTVR